MNWSSTVVRMFEFFSFFSFNIEIAAPECINPAINFFSKAEFMFLLPPAFAMLFILFSFLSTPPCSWPITFIKAQYNHEAPIYPKFSWVLIQKNLSNSLRAFHILLQFTYVSLTSWALGYFNCYRFGDILVLTKSPVYECYTGEHGANMGYFVAAVIIYVIGIPLYFTSVYIIIYQRRFKSPFAEKLKTFYEKIIGNKLSIYKKDVQFTLVAQLLLKLVLIMIQNFLHDPSDRPMQAVIILLALFCYFGFLIHFKPYSEKDHNFADMLCQICSLLTICIGILFLTNSDEGKVPGLTSVVVLITSLCVLSSFIFVSRDLHRGKKILTLKRREKTEEKRLETMRRASVISEGGPAKNAGF